MFSYYDGDKHLNNNMEYKLEINLNGKAYNLSFTSRYTPMYSTSKIVKTDLQDIILGISEDTINFTIWQNSILANEKAQTKITDDKIPYYVKQWVRYKTEIDLVYAVYLAISGKSGMISNKLGSLQIERQFKIPFLKDMLGELKDKLDEFERQLTGVRVLGKKTRKAGKVPYPISERRSF